MALDTTAYENAAQEDGNPSLDALAVAVELAERNREIRDGFMQQGGWAYPNKGDALTDGLNYGDLSLASDSIVEIARFTPPKPAANGTRKVDIWIYVANVEDDNVEYAFFGDDVVRWTPESGDTGWHVIEGIVVTAELAILATVTGSTTQVVTAVSCFASQSEPDALQTIALFGFEEERPHGVVTVRSIDALQNHVQTSYPLARGSHFLGGPQGKSSQAEADKARYRFWVGPAVSMTLAVLTKMTGSDTSLSFNFGPVDMEGDTKQPFGGASPSASDSETLNDSTPTWHEFLIDAEDVTPNALHEVEIGFENGSGSIEVMAICLMEKGVTLFGQAVGDDDALVTTEDEVDQRPERAILSRAIGALKPGQPVIGSFWEADFSLQGHWGDVRTMAHNALYNAIWKRQAHVIDWLRGADPNVVGISDGEVTVARWLYVPSRGAARLRVHLRTQRYTGNRTQRVFARFVVNGVEQTQQEAREGLSVVELAVTDDNTSRDIELKLFYTDANGNPTPFGDANDKTYLSALWVEEVPISPDPRAQYFRKVTAVSATTIPASDPTGAVKTITVTTSFTVRRVRFWAQVDHPDASQLQFKLTGPAGSPVTLSGAIDVSDTLKSYSDAVFGDIHLGGGLLSDLVPQDSAGTWTLQVINPSGADPGTFKAWALELT